MGILHSMKRTGVLLISIGVNLALVVVVASQRQAMARFSKAVVPAVVARPINLAKTKKEQQFESLSSATRQVPIFNWQSVESLDYKTYIAQLRSIGCPKETICDIIAADVRKLFDQKREALLSKTPPKYWQSKYSTSFSLAQEQQLRAVDQEEKRVLEELLGPDLEKPVVEMEVVRVQGKDLQLDGLSPKTRQKIYQWKDKFASLESELLENLIGGRVTPTVEQKLKELQQQRQAELAALLTPAELEQFQVRNSDTAERLRAATADVDLSEEEFLKIFRMRKSLDDHPSEIDGGNKSAVARQQVEDQIKQLLGEQKYAELQRGSDPDYRDLTQLAQRYELSPAVATTVYDWHQTANQQRLLIEGNVSLDEPTRTAALAELRRRTESRIKSLIGERAFKAYQEVLGVEPDP